MLFDQRDLGLLHLTGWCRHLSLSVLERFQSPMLSMQTLGPLVDARLLHITKDGKSLRLRAEGYALLDALGIPCPRDNKYPDSDTRTRRLAISEMVATFLQAGVNVYGSQLEHLRSPPVFLGSAAIRSNPELAGNLFNGVSFAGIASFGGRDYQVQLPSERNIYFSNEMRAFMNFSALSGNEEKAVIYAGGSYSGLLDLLVLPPSPGKRKNDRLPYLEAYRRTVLPVHLLECSETGALQLRVMQQPGYRGRLAEAALGARYAPPLPALPDTDAMFMQEEPVPFVTGVDMDLKRLDRAYSYARAAGYPRLAIAALREQLPALGRLYRANGKASLYEISGSILKKAFGPQALLPYEPELIPLTIGGKPMHVSDLKAHLQAGRPD